MSKRFRILELVFAKGLVAAPCIDEVTEYSQAWALKLVDDVNRVAPILQSVTDTAVRENVEDMLPDFDLFVHYDHGSEYAMWGADKKEIIDLSNLSKLKDKHVYCMNCSSGIGLGSQAVAKGLLEYWGYNDVVEITTDALEEFGESFNFGLIQAVTKNIWLKDVVEEARNRGLGIADSLQTSGRTMAASCLVRDMNALHCYYLGGPESPQPECEVSSLLKTLFGWNGLWFFRMLRQKLKQMLRLEKPR